LSDGSRLAMNHLITYTYNILLRVMSLNAVCRLQLRNVDRVQEI
jgi:hypothetical protein